MVISNVSLISSVSAPEDAVSVYAVPTRSMLKSGKLATPATAFCGVVPESTAFKVPDPGVMTMPTGSVNPVSRFPSESRAVTATVGIAAFWTVFTGCVVKRRVVADPGFTENAALAPADGPVADAVSV
jgi:hypothetical protein